MRYISGGREAQLERFAIPIKFVTAEKDAVPNAARNIPSPLSAILASDCTRIDKKTWKRKNLL